MIRKGRLPLSQQFPEAVERLKDGGFECISEMMKHFSISSDMDRAIGTKNAVARWMDGRTTPRMKQELAAWNWLEINGRALKGEAKETKPGPVIYVEPKRVPVEVKDERIFLVACPADKGEKLIRVLRLMGCEAEEM